MEKPKTGGRFLRDADTGKLVKQHADTSAPEAKAPKPAAKPKKGKTQ